MVKFEPHPLAYASWCRRGSKLEMCLHYSSVRGSERYTRGKETEGSTYPMQSRPDWYGSEGFGAKSGVHQISVHAVHTIMMGSDQQHALSLDISHTTWNTFTEGL